MKTMLVRKAVNYEQAFKDTKDLIQKFGGRIEEFEVEKVIEMNKEDFEIFKKTFLQDQDFIKENREVTHFFVIEKGAKTETGICVDTEGSEYARYTGLPISEENFFNCSKCGKYFIGYPALSRKDNKSEVCSECGVAEALEDLKNKEVLKFCQSLQDKSNELGAEIIVKLPNGYERRIKPNNK